MFSSQTVINGVALPNEFNGGSIVNNVAINRAGTRYAVVGADNQIVIGDIPADGNLDINGMKMNVGRGQGVSVSSRAGISFSSVRIGGSGISVQMGSDRKEEISQDYERVTELLSNSKSGDITLRISESNKVTVTGSAKEKPDFNGGVLDLGDFEGTISVPRSGVRVNIKTTSGDIDGEIAVPGQIRATSGDITIKLLAPIKVRASTTSGDIDVEGMISRRGGKFEPPEPTSELLEIDATSGDISVEYRSRA